MHPDGRLIALSVTRVHSVGGARDSVYVLPVGAGGPAPVFRRYLATYARSGVAFPARDRFAYTEWDGRRAEVVVLRIPPDLLGP
ncbi:MAG: hypothetical protein HYR51_11565 [Candidatus Rokubacteria bacterium]|nr:hypothetical protein [Candidatus Rokubacteria bacterium]